jgi:hypothetical protein
MNSQRGPKMALEGNLVGRKGKADLGKDGNMTYRIT